MSYATIYATATDATFQARCRAALWDVCNKVAGQESGFPAAGQADANAAEDRDYALRVLRDESRITDRVLAMQVLRNGTIAGDPASASDGDIQYQVNSIWASLRRIG
jgi:hypothetical protein